ncbi:hypothetical protein Bca101_013207 [Brassica carinata]
MLATSPVGCHYTDVEAPLGLGVRGVLSLSCVSGRISDLCETVCLSVFRVSLRHCGEPLSPGIHNLSGKKLRPLVLIGGRFLEFLVLCWVTLWFGLVATAFTQFSAVGNEDICLSVTGAVELSQERTWGIEFLGVWSLALAGRHSTGLERSWFWSTHFPRRQFSLCSSLAPLRQPAPRKHGLQWLLATLSAPILYVDD